MANPLLEKAIGLSEALGPRTRMALLCVAATATSSALSVLVFLGIRVFAPSSADGGALWVIALVGLITSFCAAAPMIAFVVTIVTRLRRTRSELHVALAAAQSASTSKSAFLANMSHEIRTPLNGVMGMTQVLGSTDLSSTQRDYVRAIQESGGTLMALLNDILDLSKIEAGRFEVVHADASLWTVMRRQHQLWLARAAEKRLDLVLTIPEDVPDWLSFDQIRIQQCVSNLLSNAIKFTESGGVEIAVSARPGEGGTCLVEIRVSDTGAGMDAETLGRLFQPFAQADATTQRRHGGTGLGLSITRRLAELMGGTAGATSVAGEGSVFFVTFLARSAGPRPVSAPAEGPEDRNQIRETVATMGLRILLVDDQPINRRIASLFLTPLNLRIVEAENGVAALSALEREAFDVVLLDMHMPVMDGPTTIRNIRSASHDWRSIPVIALTADAMSGDRERYLAMGMDSYVPKPLDERTLLVEIARVAGSRFARADGAR